MRFKKDKKGFSIGEVMIATFILLVGIVGAIMLTVKSVGNISDGREAIIASLLAQEGTELVRSVRDNTVTQRGGDCNSYRCTAFDQEANYGWPSLILGANEVTCSIDYTISGDGGLNCSEGTAKERIYLNKDTMLYSHSSGGNNVSDANLKRKIFIKYETTESGLTPQQAKTQDKIDKLVAKVTSVVVWRGGTIPNTAENIEQSCKISKHCAFAQTRLTSWINY